MLKRLKQITLTGIKATGAYKIIQQSNWRQNRLLILAYHGISMEDEHLWDKELFMPPNLFRERMELIKKWNCTVLPLGEAIERLYAGDLPANSVALTFDDGYYNFYRVAHPILKEFKFPSTLYLTTYHVENNRPIKDALISYLLWKGRDKVLDLKPVTGIDMKFDLSNDGEKTRAFETVITHIRQKHLSLTDKGIISRAIANQLGIDYDLLLSKRILNLLKHDEVSQLAAEGVDIQLHTHRHRTPLNKELFYREIEENRASILKMCGYRATHLCYPSGNFDEAFFPWLEDLDVVSATTCDPGLASQQSNRLMLPRLIDTTPLHHCEFEAWLTGVAAAIPHRYKTYNMGVSDYELRPSVTVHE